jgi:hypothetical protein
MMQALVQTILQTQSFYRQTIHRKMREHNGNATFDEMLHTLRRSGGVDDKADRK